MSDDRHGSQHSVDDGDYTLSIDGNRVHYHIIEDDFKITVRIEGTNYPDDKDTKDKDKEERGTKKKED